MGPLKLSELFGEHAGAVSLRRPLTSPSRVDVTEAQLRSADSNESPVGSAFTAGTDVAVAELVQDIYALIKQQLNDARIAEQLGLSEDSIQVISYLRSHCDEL